MVNIWICAQITSMIQLLNMNLCQLCFMNINWYSSHLGLLSTCHCCSKSKLSHYGNAEVVKNFWKHFCIGYPHFIALELLTKAYTWLCFSPLESGIGFLLRLHPLKITFILFYHSPYFLNHEEWFDDQSIHRVFKTSK